MDVYSASMGNVDATCQTNSDVEFSKANGIYEISFNISHFLSMDTCSNIVQPLHMGYNANLDGNTFTLGFDVRLFSSSVSVNYGFTSMLLQPYFEIVDFSKEGSISPRRIISGIEFHFNDHTYIGNYYININMPGAAPMYCIVNKLGSVDLSNFPVPILTPDGKGVYSLCLMAFGDTMYMPVMQHFGYERDDLKLEPRSCHW